MQPCMWVPLDLLDDSWTSQKVNHFKTVNHQDLPEILMILMCPSGKELGFATGDGWKLEFLSRDDSKLRIVRSE